MLQPDPFRGCPRLADPAPVRSIRSRSAIEQRVTAAARTFEAVLARTATSMKLRARSLQLLDRPVFRPPVIARPLEPTRKKLPSHLDDRG